MMAFMNNVCVVIAKYATIISGEQMGQEKGEVITTNLLLFIDPDLLPNDADPICTPKLSFIVGSLAKVNPLATKQV
jgi:hypothetical protein